MEISRFLLSRMLSMIHCLCYIYMMIMANYFIAGALAITHTNFSTDQSALLALKAHITSDPQNILTANWSSASNSDICNWVGVTCGARHHRVTALNLSYMGLAGFIPPHLGNLSFLIELGLENNSFHGPLPQELSRWRRLKAINFGNNNFMGTIPSWFGSFAKLQTFRLYGNGFSGFIPAAIFNLSALEEINLSRNQLSGSIPREIGNLTMVKRINLDNNKFEELPNEIGSLGQLEVLFVQFNALKGSAFVPVLNISSLTTLTLFGNNMSASLPDNMYEHLSSIRRINFGRNQLDGPIPKSLGNLTYLTEIVLVENNLTDTIPDEIGDLPQLEILALRNNNLNGVIPSKLFNNSMVREIELSINQLSGSLPANIGLNLPKLEILYVAQNNLVAGLPNLSNASKFRRLDMSVNSFTGILPTTLCSLKNLEYLGLYSNNLTIDASTPQAASTLSCLFNLRNLKRLDLGDNPLNTTIPASRGNRSTSLLYVDLRISNIRGNIPVDIGNLSSLLALYLENNQLSGAIPSSIQRLKNLQGLYLNDNQLQGHIPYELCQLNNLAELILGGNRLSGSIPSCLGTMAVALRSLSLGSNLLTSKIPSSLWELKYILHLNLSSNSLDGPLSEDIRKLRDVMDMDLSNNHFSGNIPGSIGGLQNMINFSLANNYLEGPIPSSFKTLLSLEFLDLSKNNLSGEIPKSLEALLYLKHLNLSFNKLQGEIPTGGPFINFSADSFVSNGALCGASRLHVPLCKNRTKVKPNWRKAKYIISGVISVILLAAAALILILPREIGNLTMVKGIYLDHNKFKELPNEIGSLGQLEELFVQNNALKGFAFVPVLNISSLTAFTLYGNNMSGSLPDNMCERLLSIRRINLAQNQLDGLIPSKLWQCKELLEISFNSNNFRGSIPKSLGNLTYLSKIHLSNNNLEGTIPDEIGDLPQLEVLSLGINNLNGVIPFKLFNNSKIRVISLSFNQLSGGLPANIGLNVPNLETLYVSRNNLVAGLLPNLSNASKLRELAMNANSFTGILPITLCSLKNLELLNLYLNHLTIDASTPQAASTLSCLFNLRNLTELFLGDNPLNTTIPASRGNLSTSLLYVDLGFSNIRGNIPIDIGNLSSLIALTLENNQLTGAIPTSIQRLQNLQALYLNDNVLRGHIPYELCQLTNLAELDLGGNRLTGSIPSCLGNLSVALRSLWLGSNLLTSKIPSSLWELKYILHLNLSSNSLVGPLTEDVGKLRAVVDMDLSNNHFSGNIPGSIGGLQNMINLSLANNYLEGPIPTSFKTLLSLEFLDLSKNNLSGEIPKSMETLLYLKHLNLSFNKLQGEIPTSGPFGNFSADSFVSNAALCGASRLHVPLCKKRTEVKPKWRKAKYIISGVISVILLAAAALILILRKKRNVEVVRETTSLHQVLWRRVSRLELVKATNGFHESNLLGTGGFGSVYRGTLSDGIDIAVKVFNLQLEGAFKSFDKECEMLSNIRRRNLIKIISCCDELDFKALILQLMPNGSLEKWLYSPNRSMTFLQRLDIMKDVALALEYLHHGYSIPIVHCDVKPSNILLDDDMVAHVADFGIARLIGGGDSMTETMTLATVGYMAPEYGMEGRVSTRGDVYSFGIVLMETFTKRKPTDEMFVGEMNLKQWIADSLFPDAAIDEVVDADILGTEEDGDFVSRRYCLSSVMRLALACCAALPEERINMKDVAVTLNKIKTKYLKDSGGVKS